MVVSSTIASKKKVLCVKVDIKVKIIFIKIVSNAKDTLRW